MVGPVQSGREMGVGRKMRHLNSEVEWTPAVPSLLKGLSQGGHGSHLLIGSGCGEGVVDER